MTDKPTFLQEIYEPETVVVENKDDNKKKKKNKEKLDEHED